MADYFIYNHGGSENHGCEALVRTISKMFPDSVIYSEAPQQDLRYEIPGRVEPAMTAYSRLTPAFAVAYLRLKRTGDYMKMDVLPYRKPLAKLPRGSVELSVGGDIYCYEDYRKFILLHTAIAKKHPSVLLGCSLDEKLFRDPEFVADMKRYTYISARESLTYEMLKKAGISHIGLTPDSAFTLETECLPLPEGFLEGNTIGINVSPLVLRKETREGVILESLTRLIRHILDTTDCNIALIPHVVWESNDDHMALQALYKAVNRPDRVIQIPDCNCKQLKGYISRCRFFVGARTHATIAAYSTGVPTLVLGYSVKSRGIAKDLFGTDEHYVLPVQKLEDTARLTQEFDWLWNHEQAVRKHLAEIMPGYIAKAKELPTKVEQALERM